MSPFCRCDLRAVHGVAACPSNRHAWSMRDRHHPAPSFAQRERLQLAALFDEVGPDAPTLCDGWIDA